MSHRIACRYCEDEFTPSLGKPGYYDVCVRCTERELAENPGLEPEPLRAGPSIDEAGTFAEVMPASKLASRSTNMVMRAFTTEQLDDAATPMRATRARCK